MERVWVVSNGHLTYTYISNSKYDDVTLIEYKLSYIYSLDNRDVRLRDQKGMSSFVHCADERYSDSNAHCSCSPPKLLSHRARDSPTKTSSHLLHHCTINNHFPCFSGLDLFQAISPSNPDRLVLLYFAAPP